MTPQSDPKVIQMDMGKPFKTYCIYCLGNTMGHPGWPRKSNFSLFAVLGRVFQQFCTAFGDLGAEKVPKRDYTFVAEGTPKSTKRNKETRLHRWGSQWCHSLPRRMEMTPKSDEKSNQISTKVPQRPHCHRGLQPGHRTCTSTC